MNIRGNRSFQRHTSATQELSGPHEKNLPTRAAYTSYKDRFADPVEAAMPTRMMIIPIKRRIKSIFLRINCAYMSYMDSGWFSVWVDSAVMEISKFQNSS